MTSGLLVFDPSFYRRAAAFAQQYPYYQQQGGTVNMYHIINAVRACGYFEVNSDNIDDVMRALEARAETKEAQA